LLSITTSSSLVSSADLEAGEALMLFWLPVLIITFILELITRLGHANRNKDLENIILSQQVRILQRKLKTHTRVSDLERIILTTLMDKFSQSTKEPCQRLHQVMLIFKLNIVLRWNRELVRRKRTFSRKAKPGRLTISSDLESPKPRIRDVADCVCLEQFATQTAEVGRQPKPSTKSRLGD